MSTRNQRRIAALNAKRYTYIKYAEGRIKALEEELLSPYFRTHLKQVWDQRRRVNFWKKEIEKTRSLLSPSGSPSPKRVHIQEAPVELPPGLDTGRVGTDSAGVLDPKEEVQHG